jgi:lipoate-protein ligase A
VSQRKIIGSAQLRRGSALLQHGSILLEDDQRLVEDLLRNGRHPQSHSATGSFSLADETGRPLLPQEIAATLGNQVRDGWPGDWDRVRDPSPIIRAAASRFELFQSSAWTWGR